MKNYRGGIHMYRNNSHPNLISVLRKRPQAWASITGSDVYPHIHGMVEFFQTNGGVVVWASILGLPQTEDKCRQPIFAFHIHAGERCTGNAEDPFAYAGMHDNPYGCPHPYHAGDMPPLFGAGGSAISVFLTDRFEVKDIIGKTVIIHASPDDFATQPSGNAGIRIACGEIRRSFPS